MEEVGRLYMRGLNATQISRELDIPRKEAKSLLDEWRVWLKNVSETNLDIKDRVMAVLYEVDEHWRLVIKEAWDTVEQAESAGQFGTKTSTLKLIASINKDRAQMFQQAGLNQDEELIAQLNEAQRAQEVLVQTLKEIKQKHPEVAEIISRQLANIESEVEVVAIEEGGDEE